MRGALTDPSFMVPVVVVLLIMMTGCVVPQPVTQPTAPVVIADGTRIYEPRYGLCFRVRAANNVLTLVAVPRSECEGK